MVASVGDQRSVDDGEDHEEFSKVRKVVAGARNSVLPAAHLEKIQVSKRKKEKTAWIPGGTKARTKRTHAKTSAKTKTTRDCGTP